MKKWMIAAMVVCVAAFAQAGDKGKGKAKGQTKEEYVAAAKKTAEKKGRKFKKASVEKKFVELDTNKDGILTKEEKKAGQKK